MVDKDVTYIVMGLLDCESIAFVIGETLRSFGAKVIYTMQNERIKRLFFDRTVPERRQESEAPIIRFCDVTRPEELERLFSRCGPIGGVVHSIAYANPRTCLGEEFHTDAVEDLKSSFHISVASLADVVRHARPAMAQGGGIVTLTFDSHRAYPYYNWMGVNKAALEAVVRALARRHGRDLIRVNAVSAGPLSTRAANAIPGFGHLSKTWEALSPLPWDSTADKRAVADAAAFLLGPYSGKITGQTLYVDGGASIAGGVLEPHERPGAG